MRMLIAIAFGCALMFEVSHAASSGTMARGVPQATERSSSENQDADGLEDASQFVCFGAPGAPPCSSARDCTNFCAGGVPRCGNHNCCCDS
jgi:hypothetical protein